MSYKESIPLMREYGFKFLRMGKGSHQIWVHPQSGVKITIAVDNGKARSITNLRSRIKRVLKDKV